METDLSSTAQAKDTFLLCIRRIKVSTKLQFVNFAFGDSEISVDAKPFQCTFIRPSYVEFVCSNHTKKFLAFNKLAFYYSKFLKLGLD